MRTDVLVVAPIKLALAILNEVFGLIFTTKISLLDVFTTTTEPFVVLVLLFLIVAFSKLPTVV